MLKDLILKNRSYRGYDESYSFTREQMESLIDGARFCPSSKNAQPLKFYAAYEKKDVDAIQPLVRWAAQLPGITLPHPGHCPTGFIVICQDTDISTNLNMFQRDAGIAAQTMLLLAAEESLGGCMIGNFIADELKHTLSLPENIRPLLVVALGKPDEKVVLTDVGEGGSTVYYRDENDVHYVPKRSLKDLMLN